MGATSTTKTVIFNNQENENMALIIHEAKKSFNCLAILKFHKDMTEEVNFVEIENTFVSSLENRLNQFGKLTS